MKKFNISIIGTGSLGTALAYLILNNKHNLTVFEPNKKNLHTFLNHPNIKKHKNITSNKTIDDCITDNFDYIIPCIPSKHVNSFYKVFSKNQNTRSHIISISKGLYPSTTKTISQKILSIIPTNKLSILSGPSFSSEILKNYPTTTILASKSKQQFKKIQSIFENNNFKLKYSNKIIETELGGILKNCYSITLGVLDHYYGMNTKSIAIFAIKREVEQFYTKLKLSQKPVQDLSFESDLIATGLNPSSRNTTFGHILKYKKNTTIEGADNIKPILSLARKNKINLPILSQTHKIILSPTKTNIKKLTQIILESI